MDTRVSLVVLLALASFVHAPHALADPAGSQRCTAGNLQVTADARMTAVSGQNPIAIRITNVGSSPCTLRGYPTPALLDARGRSLPFVISRAGNGEVTARRPGTVWLTHGHAAFVTVSKYRCDVRDLTRAATLGLRLAAGTRRFSVKVGTVDLGYCGRGDPGSTLYISPYEPTLRDTTAFG